jgi:hypothetical protein
MAGPGVGERTIEPPLRGGGRVHAPERSEQVGGGLGLSVIAVVEEADEGREAERAAHQHGLVVGLVGVLAEPDDIADGGLELGLGQLHLAGEGMQVAHQRRHDLLEPGIGGALQLGQHRLGDVVLILDDHVGLRAWLRRHGRTCSGHPRLAASPRRRRRWPGQARP